MPGDQVERGKAKAAGIASCFLAALAFGNAICGFIWVSYGGPDASGIWSGVVMGITAALGIAVWIKKSKTVMVFYLVLCIIGLILAVIQVIIALFGWLIWHVIRKVVEENCDMVGDTCHCSGKQDVPIKLDDCDAIYTIEHCFMAIVLLSSLATIFLLAGSIIGCMATCCASNNNQTAVVVVQQPGVIVQQQTMTQPPAGVLHGMVPLQPPGMMIQQGQPPQQEMYPMA